MGKISRDTIVENTRIIYCTFQKGATIDQIAVITEMPVKMVEEYIRIGDYIWNEKVKTKKLTRQTEELTKQVQEQKDQIERLSYQIKCLKQNPGRSIWYRYRHGGVV